MVEVSGPGLTSATANHPTNILVKLADSSGRPYAIQMDVSAQLEIATPTNQPRVSHKISLPVAMKSRSQYEISYTAVDQGQYNLHIQVDEREIHGSPFSVTVYPNPIELSHKPRKMVPGLSKPCNIAFNSLGYMIVTELQNDMLSVFDSKGKKIQKYGSNIQSPRGIAIDEMDNIYVTSKHRLQKFDSSGTLLKFIGQRGKKEGEFNNPHGLAIHEGQVYVCDRDNHRIQVFSLDLCFVKFIGSRRRGEFNAPCDVKFDAYGNIYVAEFGKKRVQVVNEMGQFLRAFGEEGEGKLREPSGLFVADKYVYVSDYGGHCIVVYETSGQFVTSLGRHGEKEGEFHHPNCVTFCADGFIYACDHNNRVQIF